VKSDVVISWLQVGVGALLGLVATFLGVAASNRQARRIAELSGVFRRPKFGLQLFGFNVPDEHIIGWCFRHPGPPGTDAFFRLAFAITNGGDLRGEDLILTLQGPAQCFGNPEGLGVNPTPAVAVDLVRRGQSDMGFLRQVSYAVSRVGAMSAVGIGDIIVMSPSVGIEKPHVFKLKGDVEMAATVGISYSYSIEWGLYSPDAPGIRYAASFFCVEGASAADVARRFRKLLAKRVRKYLASAGRWERFRFNVLRLGEHRRVLIVDFGDGEEESIDGTSVVRLDQSDYRVSSVGFLIPRALPWP
jgi:hypothetical protein